jgi:adenylate kinase
MSELNLILLGPPGAGKGTQAERLIEDFRLPYIATGNILREAVEKKTELGLEAKRYMDAGDLVPDEVITGVVTERLAGADTKDGFILELEKMNRSITAALLIDVPDDEVVRRISGRRVSVKTGRVYHIEFDPPKHPDRCDVDGSRLIQRDDDKPETVRKRLEVYHRQTAPLVDYYDRKNVLRRFDGARPPQEVHDHIRATLATLRLEERI